MRQRRSAGDGASRSPPNDVEEIIHLNRCPTRTLGRSRPGGRRSSRKRCRNGLHDVLHADAAL